VHAIDSSANPTSLPNIVFGVFIIKGTPEKLNNRAEIQNPESQTKAIYPTIARPSIPHYIRYFHM
jgi:hypothetical protein